MSDLKGVARRLLDLTRTTARGTAFLATVPPLRRYLRGRWEGPDDVPPPGLVRFGDLRRLEPLSRDWGADRGGAVDRYYIENFLEANGDAIRGRVMEVGDDSYVRRFGGEALSHVDVLGYPPGANPAATLVADLSSPSADLPRDCFHCVVVTQTLQLVYDVHTAVGALHGMLAPGGVALVTVPGISQVVRDDPWAERWYWIFTALSMKRVFGAWFSPDEVQVGTHGNVLAATAFLHGVGRGELTRDELDYRDPDYEMLITVRASKGGA